MLNCNLNKYFLIIFTILILAFSLNLSFAADLNDSVTNLNDDVGISDVNDNLEINNQVTSVDESDISSTGSIVEFVGNQGDTVKPVLADDSSNQISSNCDKFSQNQNNSFEEVSVVSYDSINEDEISSGYADSVISGSTFKDIQNALNNASNGDIILLNSSYYSGDGNYINCSKNLTIQSVIGLDVILDAKNLSSIIHIFPHNFLTFRNLTFVNGNGLAINESGAIMYGFSNAYDVNYNAKVYNCKFINNSGVYGGAIKNSVIFDSFFENNSALNSGGAIYAGDIVNCTFKNNFAKNSGGACAEMNNVFNSTFIANYANNSCGAVYTTDRGFVDNCSFINNCATNIGSGSGKFVRCLFMNSSAKEYGGALAYASAYNCNFTNCFTTNGSGGAIYDPTFDVINCSIINCSASKYGGGIYDDGMPINLFNNSMENLSALISGNYIYLTGKASINGSNLKFLNNTTLISVKDQICPLIANLTDLDDNPISGSHIYFYLNGTLIGISEVKEGIATLYYNTSHPYNSSFIISGNYSLVGSVVNVFNGTLNLTNYNTVILVNNISGFVNKNHGFSVSVRDNFNHPVSEGTLNLKINGKNYTVNVINGLAYFNFVLPSDSRNYTMDYEYIGNDKYNSSNASAVAIVNPLGENDIENTSIFDENLTTVINGTVVINVVSGKTVNKGKIEVYYNDTLVNSANVNNGKANVNVSNLSSGTYSIFVKYIGEDEFLNSNKTINLTILGEDDRSTYMLSYNYTAFYGENGNFTANLTDINGNPVSGKECVFVLKNKYNETKNYWRTTNSDGIAKLTITLIPETWSISTYFPGDDIWNKSNNYSSSVIISSKQTIMQASNYTNKYGVSGNFTTKLADSKGNPISGKECALVLKNIYNETKVYWRTTNTEGIAKLAIALIPNTWYITAYYPGDYEWLQSNNSTATLIISK